MKRQKLETAILELLRTGIAIPEAELYNVTAYGLTHDGEGWSVNSPFRFGREVTFERLLEIARGRWEVFKGNYMPKARVSDISDIGYDGETFELECAYVPFLQISLCKPE